MVQMWSVPPRDEASDVLTPVWQYEKLVGPVQGRAWRRCLGPLAAIRFFFSPGSSDWFL